jgi:hypothetical protein
MNDEADTCIDCLVGYYQENEGSSSCLDCTPGMYSKNKKSTICENCKRGQYRSQKDEDASQCLHCPAGFYQGSVGRAACLPKTEGWILEECNENGGDTECKKTEQCPVGTYQNDSKSTLFCQKCPIGWSSSAGTTKCQTCNKGEYGKEDGTCYKCKSGRFGPKVRATKCFNCPGGWEQPTEGSESCIDLKWKKPEECDYSTQYLNANDIDPNNWQCQPCPNGAFCEGDVTWEEVVALQGWWRISWSNRSFAECPYEDDCVGY